MLHELPELPYSNNELEPYISAETLEYHHGKHHQAYVTNLNNLIAGTEYESKNTGRNCEKVRREVFSIMLHRFGIIPFTGILSVQMAVGNLQGLSPTL